MFTYWNILSSVKALHCPMLHWHTIMTFSSWSPPPADSFLLAFEEHPKCNISLYNVQWNTFLISESIVLSVSLSQLSAVSFNGCSALVFEKKTEESLNNSMLSELCYNNSGHSNMYVILFTLKNDNTSGSIPYSICYVLYICVFVLCVYVYKNAFIYSYGISRWYVLVCTIGCFSCGMLLVDFVLSMANIYANIV